MSNLIRSSSLLLVFVFVVAAFVGFAQEKKQPKEKKEKPFATGSIITTPLPAEYDAAAWKKFESSHGGFSVLLPGTPQEETDKIKSGEHEVGVYILKLLSLAAYTVMYLDNQVEPHLNKEATRKLLDSAARQATQMFQATTLEQKEITLGGYPGMSYVLRMPDGLVTRLRVYAVRQRLYQLMITTPSEQGATDDQRRFYEATANKFLDSFTLAPAIHVAPPVGRVVEESGQGASDTPAAPKKPRRAPISGGILNGKALSKPAPVYPEAARQAGVSGTVEVAIVVDEEGRVIEAEALSGPVELREAAVAAARKARFSQTRLSGQLVKISGRLVYNFWPR